MPKYPQNVRIGPGDSGPCPRCGAEMKEKQYNVNTISPEVANVKASGRYWHMRYEHGILEDYAR